LYPIKAEFNHTNEELIVSTRNDIRFLDFANGQTKRIFVNLVDSDEADEITVFRLIQKRKWFVIGDHKGNVNIYNYNTGELVKKLSNHQSELSSLKIDYTNKLFITTSLDSQIKLQKELSNVYSQENKIHELEAKHEKMLTIMKSKDITSNKINDIQEKYKKEAHKNKGDPNKNRCKSKNKFRRKKETYTGTGQSSKPQVYLKEFEV
jgi:WD40 repeat protein